jgi:hypothetical protein
MKTSLLLVFALIVASVGSTASAAPGSIRFTSAEVAQVLQFYADLTGFQLVVDSRVGKTRLLVTIDAKTPGQTEAAKLIEKALLEQTGIVITRLDEKRASVTYNDALPITPATSTSKKRDSRN